jgi:DNA-binding transcriptional LysR family regulator
MVAMYRELRQFIVLVETGSITRAADALGLTQPALSKSLQRLEDMLGLQLAERGARGLVLTDEGRLVYDHARRIDAEMRYLELDARATGNGLRRSVRIGASPSWSVACVPDLVDQLGRSDRDLAFSVHVDLEAELIRQLAEGDLDLVLCSTAGGGPEHGIAREPLVDVGVRIACRAGHPVLSATQDDLDPLFGCDWIDYQHALDQPAWDMGPIRGRVRGNIVRTSSWMNALMMAARTDAILPLPAQAGHLLPGLGLRFIDGLAPVASFKAGIWYRTSFPLTKTGKAACRMARALMAAHAAGGPGNHS